MTKGICAAIKTDPMIKTHIYNHVYIFNNQRQSKHFREREKNQNTRKEMFKSLYFIGYVIEKSQTFTRPLRQYPENKNYIHCILLMGMNP